MLGTILPPQPTPTQTPIRPSTQNRCRTRRPLCPPWRQTYQPNHKRNQGAAMETSLWSGITHSLNPVLLPMRPNNRAYTLLNTAAVKITVTLPDARNIRVGEELKITYDDNKYYVESIRDSFVTLCIRKEPSPCPSPVAPLTKKRAQWLQQTYPNQNRGRK